LFKANNVHDNIGDFIFGTTFLCLFVIQKSFNRYSALVHLKMNELISSNESANNAVMDDSAKTEHDILRLSKEYMEQQEAIEEEIITEELIDPDTDPLNR
jgi:low affinity Fe/Cu permease